MDGTILIIDYSEYEREKAKIAFDNIGEFEFIEVNNLQKFYNLSIKSKEISLLVLDLALPTQKEGFEVLSTLRKKPETSSVPAIILTKWDDSNYKRTALKFNVQDYIIKPYTTKRLESSIRSILKIDQSFSYNISSANVITMSIEDYITKEFKIASRANQNLSIILLTPIVTTLKSYNLDFLNNVYKTVIEKVKLSSRSTDTVILNDNKDILVILPFTNDSGASRVVEKIKNNVATGLNDYGVNFNDLFYAVHTTFPIDGKNFQALMEKATKRVEDKIMLEKITSIGANALDNARKKYNRFKI
ncbi:UNVERIFIED_CONTAM: Response regulator containing a CheY-like receiver domain and a GGDEF domain [Acetivibrio alkalicellulosi]